MPRVSELLVNGHSMRIDADAERSLLSVLREDLDFTGCKYGCGEGQCGACTVLINGKPTRSCTTPVGDAAGRQITTIESLEHEGHLHPVQQAFLDDDALQCGYCIPGMILAAVALLQKNPAPSDEEIVHAMNGHICRCSVYPRILKAIKAAAVKMRSANP